MKIRRTPREQLRALATLFKGFNDQTLENLDTCDNDTALALLDVYDRMMTATRESDLGRAWAERAAQKGVN